MSQTKDTRQILIETAMELFLKNGFKGTSIRDIANLAGMPTSNLYYYFENKEGLILSILEQASKEFVGILREAANTEFEPLERFTAVVKTHIEQTVKREREGRIFFLDKEALPASGLKLHQQYQKDVLNIYRQLLADLKKSGYIQHTDLTNLAFNILGVLNWHFRWYKAEKGPTPEEIKERALRFVLNAILEKKETSGPNNEWNLDAGTSAITDVIKELSKIGHEVDTLKKSLDRISARLKSIESYLGEPPAIEPSSHE